MSFEKLLSFKFLLKVRFDFFFQLNLVAKFLSSKNLTPLFMYATFFSVDWGKVPGIQK
jgi:hypothetical protein